MQQNFRRLCLVLLLLSVLSCSSLSAQQYLYQQDPAFQTITPTPARAGSFDLYAYGPAHFVARARELLYPADFAVFDSLGQPSGQHFTFLSALPTAIPLKFVADSAGNAYIAGSYPDTSQLPIGQSLIVVAKFHPNGVPDSTWGQNGIWYGDTVLTGQWVVRGLQVLASGAVLLVDAPIVSGAGSPYFYLRRLTPAGQLDPAFGVQGSTLLNPDNRPDNAFFFAEDGSTYAGHQVGSVVNSGMARWLPDGTRDSSFWVPGALLEVYNILPDGRILSNGLRLDGSWGLRRHWSDGRVDSSYVAPSLPQFDGASARADGGHVFYATAYNGTPYPTQASITHILPDGMLDPAYMPAGLPALFQIPASFWPAPGCHASAYPTFGSILALGPRRLVYADLLYAEVSIGGSHHDYEYFLCPRITALQSDLQAVGLPAPGEVDVLRVFPNPVGGRLSVFVPTRARSAQVALFDVAGRAVVLPTAEVVPLADGLQYDFQGLEDLPAGLYLLRVEAGGRHFVGRLVKE